MAIVCLFPFLVVVAAIAGGDIRKTITIRMGLNAQAAQDIDGLISNGHQAVATLTFLGVVFLAMSAIAIASTLQGWYERVYALAPPQNWRKQLVYRTAWVIGFLVYR